MSFGSLKLCVLFVAAACACMLAVEARPLDGMSDFDREAFLGRWYEVSSYTNRQQLIQSCTCKHLDSEIKPLLHFAVLRDRRELDDTLSHG